MQPTKLIDLLVKGGASLQEIADYLQIIQQIVSRTSQYEAIQSIIQTLDLSEYPSLSHMADVLSSAGLLDSKSLTALVRVCESRSSALVVHTSDPQLMDVVADQIVSLSTIGLQARQGQRIYKRLLQGDVQKLLK